MDDIRVRVSSGAGLRTQLSLPAEQSATRIDNLEDVDEREIYKVDGSLLVYSSSSDTYVLMDVLRLDRERNEYVLDGGDFE